MFDWLKNLQKIIKNNEDKNNKNISSEKIQKVPWYEILGKKLEEKRNKNDCKE